MMPSLHNNCAQTLRVEQDFKEGFGADMEETLAQYYPRHLLSELAIYQARSIMVGCTLHCGI